MPAILFFEVEQFCADRKEGHFEFGVFVQQVFQAPAFYLANNNHRK